MPQSSIPPQRPPQRSLADELDTAFVETSDVRDTATAFLVGLSGRHAGKLFRLRAGESILGRSSHAVVSLQEKAVSHRHAKLTLTEGGCFVTDLQSTNGTFVNDVRVEEPLELRAGDVIRLGNSTLGYLTDAEDEQQHTRALARVTGPVLGATTSFAPSLPSHYPTAPPAFASSAAQGSIVVADPASGLPEKRPSQWGTPTVSETSSLDQALDVAALGADIFKKYRRTLFAAVAVCTCLALSSIFVLPPLATASCEILLNHGNGQRTGSHAQSVSFFAAAERNFPDSDLIKKTLSDLHLPTDKASVKEIAEHLDLNKSKSNAYEGTFSNKDATFAETYLAKHLDNYFAAETEKAIAVLEKEAALLRKQYADNEEALKVQVDSLRDYKLANVGALPGLADDKLRTAVMLEARRDELQTALSRYKKEYDLTRQQLQSEDAFVSAKVEQSKPYEQGIADVRRRIAEARAKGYADSHPELQRLLSEEQSLSRLRDQTVTSSTTDTERRTNPEHRRLTVRTAELKIQMEAAGQELGQINKRLSEAHDVAGSLPTIEAHIDGASRKLDSTKELDSKLFAELKAKELELEFERANVEGRYEVLDEPKAFPVSYTRSVILRGGLGAFLGFALGSVLMALLWLRDYARARPHRPTLNDALSH